ncbi:MAG: IMP cyclohydrolase [Candidatus Latescibacterota bacterium]|jgi:IMP cyclohydrolase
MLQEVAAKNLTERVAQNPYPGRGIVVGRATDGSWIQVYWIMGRSENSRNRLFVCEDGILRTQAADPAKVEDPSLIIYHAMRTSGQRFIVSNGVQTDAIWRGLEAGSHFTDTLKDWHHEPDAPNYTPRISGYIDLSGDRALLWLSILKVSPFTIDEPERHFFRYESVDGGYGYAITTYMGDGDPLPSFSGSPYILGLPGNADEIAAHFWQNLDADNKISLAVRHIDANSGREQITIKNRYQAV